MWKIVHCQDVVQQEILGGVMISFNLLLEYGENIPPQMTKAIPLHCLTREEVTRVLERHKYWLEIVGSANQIPSEDDVNIGDDYDNKDVDNDDFDDDQITMEVAVLSKLLT